MIGIYKITNPLNEIYIGQSKNIQKRFAHHRTNCSNKRLKESIGKYGFENHECEVIIECDENELKEKESFYISEYIKTHVVFNSEAYPANTGRKYLGTKQVNVMMLPLTHIIESTRKHAMNLSLKEINKNDKENYYKVLVWFRFVSDGDVEKDFEIHYTYALSQEDAKRKVTIENYSWNSAIPFKYEVNQIN